MSDRWWLNGREQSEAPTISLAAPGMMGWGLFETIRVHEGRPLRIKAHIGRLFHGLRSSHLMDSMPRMSARRLWGLHAFDERHRLAPALHEVVHGVFRVYVWLDEAGTLQEAYRLSSLPAADGTYPRSGISALCVSLAHPGLGSLGKSLSYGWALQARAQAQGQGMEEAFFLRAVGERKRLMEGATSALLYRMNGAWFHAGDASTLASVTLQGLRRIQASIEGEPIQDRPLFLDELAACDGLFALSSLKLVTPVSQVYDPHRQVHALSEVSEETQQQVEEWRAALLADAPVPASAEVG